MKYPKKISLVIYFQRTLKIAFDETLISRLHLS